MPDNSTILDQIYAFDRNNAKHIKFLKEDINHIIPLIGAGMTMPFGCPSLNGLVKKLAEQWFPGDQDLHKKIDSAITKGNIYEVIDELDEPKYFNTNIRTAIQKYFEDNPPDLKDSHRVQSFEKIIRRLSTEIILTTNYDDAIERIIKRVLSSYWQNIEHRVFFPNNMLSIFDRDSADKLKVLKFHGDFNHTDSLIFKSRSFDEKYTLNDVKQILQKMVAGHSVLFLGCSLNDDPFITIFKELSTHSQYHHYAILPKPEDNNKLQFLERQAFQMKTSIIWIKEGEWDWIDEIIDHIYILSSMSVSGGTKEGLPVKQDKPKIQDDIVPEDKPKDMTKDALVEFFQSKISVNEMQGNPTYLSISIPMYKIEGEFYEIYLISENGMFYLSDGGTTYTELDKIFEMKERDVIKNLVAILKQYGCRKQDNTNAFIITCTLQDIHVKMSCLIQAISFMLNMKIFFI